jgi:tryptophanase
MENARQVSDVCRRHGIPLYFDACRFAENAWFIKLREPGYSSKSPKEIAQEMFQLGDGCTMSAKKDGMANIGGFLCTNDDVLAQQEKNLLILTEGYPTYGGLAGRDLEAIAVGLQEAVEEDYLRYRIASTAYLGNHIAAAGVPIVQPPGGHAVYLDAREFLPHIPPAQFPGVALACELYLEGGVRSVEIGALMFAAAAQMDLVRLAIPRRVYTQSHIDYLVEVILEVWRNRKRIRGMKLTLNRWLKSGPAAATAKAHRVRYTQSIGAFPRRNCAHCRSGTTDPPRPQHSWQPSAARRQVHQPSIRHVGRFR